MPSTATGGVGGVTFRCTECLFGVKIKLTSGLFFILARSSRYTDAADGAAVEVVVGNVAWLEEHGVLAPPEALARMARLQDAGRTVVLAAAGAPSKMQGFGNAWLHGCMPRVWPSWRCAQGGTLRRQQLVRHLLPCPLGLARGRRGWRSMSCMRSLRL
jgi:hypothetical protein